MAQKVLIMGESGTGKSTSMRNCDPAITAVVNPVGKPLPFKNHFETLDNVTDAREIIKYMKEQVKAGKKLIVVDDFQYILAIPYMNRIKETGWDKYNDFGANYFEIIPWSGKHYSERLWKNSKTLTKAIKEELLIDLITGRPENEAVKIIANKFDQGIFEARRLVRTEAAFVSGELNAEAYEECDLQKYQFLATLDLRTSEICRSLDGKRFFLKDRQVGKNYPPMHPWCRSTTIAVISEGDIKKLKRRALNPETGRTELVPASMTYAEWYEKYVKDNPKAKGQEKAIQNKASDQAQYQKYKKSGIDGVPASFTGFQKLKYQEPEKWELLKKDYRERKKQ